MSKTKRHLGLIQQGLKNLRGQATRFRTLADVIHNLLKRARRGHKLTHPHSAVSFAPSCAMHFACLCSGNVPNTSYRLLLITLAKLFVITPAVPDW